jgi:hypothetical protein
MMTTGKRVGIIDKLDSHSNSNSQRTEFDSWPRRTDIEP